MSATIVRTASASAPDAPIGRFSPGQRLFHWLMSAMVIAMLFIGVGMVSTVNPVNLALIQIHRPLGIAILVLVVLRIALRARRGTPGLPSDLSPAQRAAAHVSHLALYAAMVAMPLIGWAMVSATGLPVVLWAGVHLPPIAPQNVLLHTVLWQAHKVIAYLLFALVLAHLSAALMHALIRRDGVFESMAGVRLR